MILHLFLLFLLQYLPICAAIVEPPPARVAEDAHREPSIPLLANLEPERVDYSNNQADGAEIAGLLTTFATGPFKAVYVFLINEYQNGFIVRQSGCVHELTETSARRAQTAACLDMHMFDPVTERPSIEDMKAFSARHSQLLQNSDSRNRASRPRRTLGLNISYLDTYAELHVQVSSGSMTYSDPILVTLDKMDCEHDERLDESDCIWNPPEEGDRVIEPYEWSEGQISL